MPTDKFEKLDTARIAHIVSVALDEFARHRYQDASFNRIIRNCGMAKGTMYYYFKSKEDLYLTLYKATMREFSPLLRRAQAPLRSQRDVWQLLQDLIEGLWQILRQKPTIALFVSNGLIPSPNETAHPGAAAVEQLNAWLLRLAQTAQELHAWRQDLSPEALVSLLWGIWSSLRTQIAQIGREGSFLASPLPLYDLTERILRPIAPSLREREGFDLRTGELAL